MMNGEMVEINIVTVDATETDQKYNGGQKTKQVFCSNL